MPAASSSSRRKTVTDSTPATRFSQNRSMLAKPAAPGNRPAMPTIAMPEGLSFCSLIAQYLEDDSYRRATHYIDDLSFSSGARLTVRETEEPSAVAVAEGEQPPDHVVRPRPALSVLVDRRKRLDSFLDDPVPFGESALHPLAPERLRRRGPQVDRRAPSCPGLLDDQLLAVCHSQLGEPDLRAASYSRGGGEPPGPGHVPRRQLPLVRAQAAPARRQLRRP